MEDILIRIDAFLTSLNLEYEKEIYLRKDAEVDGWDVLKIKVKINKDLDEVLDIWEKATKEIYKEYDAEVRKKILLSFDTFEWESQLVLISIQKTLSNLQMLYTN